MAIGAIEEIINKLEPLNDSCNDYCEDLSTNNSANKEYGDDNGTEQKNR